MCVKGFLVLFLVLDWTQCLPQGAGAQPAMLRGRLTGFPKSWGPGHPERQDKVDTICIVPIDCGTPTSRRLYPFGAPHEHHHHHRFIVRFFDRVGLPPLNTPFSWV